MILAGDWRDHLAAIGEVDAIITDPPYSARTHGGYDGGTDGSARRRLGDSYAHWTPDDVADACSAWSPICRGWICVLTDHVLARAWEAGLGGAGRYVFAPVPVVEVGSRVRLLGDGPSSWSVWLVVARPRVVAMARWGTLPGAYVMPAERDRSRMIGGKPLTIMRAIVRDYSRGGDLIWDPCAGYGSTLAAAVVEGRRAVGCELDPERAGVARTRVARMTAQCDLALGAGPE